MQQIELKSSQKYEDNKLYKFIENNIFEELSDEEEERYRMTISYVLEPENDTDNQYPLEDILTQFNLYVSDFFETETGSNPNQFTLELDGALNDLKNCQQIIGKTVYNQEFKDEKGEIRVKLVY